MGPLAPAPEGHPLDRLYLYVIRTSSAKSNHHFSSMGISDEISLQRGHLLMGLGGHRGLLRQCVEKPF